MVVAAMKHMALNFAKLDKFEGVDFRRWQKKMHFLLSSMSVVYVLTTPIPKDEENAIMEQIMKRNKWDNDDNDCRGLILNGISDPLFDIDQNVKSFKELWDSLEAKYMGDDASSKKFLVSNFTNNKMTYSRPVMEQYNELLGILGRFTQHKMNMDEVIQAVIYALKSPLGCKINNIVGPSVVNMMEHKNSSRKPEHLKRIEKVEKLAKKPMGDDVAWWDDSRATINDETLDKFKVFKTEVELQQGSLIKRFRTDRGGEYMDTMYFHCRAVIRLPDPNLKTLGERGIECIFVGYVEYSKAFRFYVIEPTKSVLINSIVESKDAIFNENRFSLVPRPSQRSLINGTEDIGGLVVREMVTKEEDPKTFDEAMKSQDVAFWKEVINDEMDSIIGNNTWVLADLPLRCKPLSFKWIFKRKLKVDGTIRKFKARLVILGFKQKSGICYFNTYAPVARISTVRLLIAMISIHSLSIHQMDVKTTFLNGELEDEAPKQWYQKFDEVVLSNGYLLNQADKYVYSKFDESGKGVIICLYVDDMLIFGTDQVQVDLTKEFLSSRFSMKDMGEADVILGIRIKHESNGIAISQSHYIEKVLKKFNYFDCTPVSTPMDTSEKLMPNNGQAVSQLEYSRVIGCLMYAMTCTRPDIAFAVGKLSRYTSNPGTQHWQAIQRVLKYLKKTMDYRLTYIGYPSVLEGYNDASWINNTEDNSSTSGWVFLLGGGAISWAFKKQTCITGSIMEYEFVALAAAGKEAEWLKNLLLEIPLWSKPIAPISIRCDSAATLAKAYSQMYNGKSRHLGVRHSMIRELITNGVISVEFVRSQQNLADHLTKGLARDLL
ncbi:zinc finger, CCHC-type containing protein [Tanacetum coccineum]